MGIAGGLHKAGWVRDGAVCRSPASCSLHATLYTAAGGCSALCRMRMRART